MQRAFPLHTWSRSHFMPKPDKKGITEPTFSLGKYGSLDNVDSNDDAAAEEPFPSG